MLLRPAPLPLRECFRHTHSYTYRRTINTTRAQRASDPLRSRPSASFRHSSTVASVTTPPPQAFTTKAARFATATVFSLALFYTGLAMSGGAETVSAVNGVLKPPTDAETLTMFVPSTPKALEIDNHIKNHPLAHKLRATPGMKESRPHMKIPEGMRPHNLTGGVLLGEDKIEVPPLIFADNESELPSLYSISYLGKSLCGHPGIVHGGLLATMLDEGLARACFPALPNKVGVTANLKIDYRVPCPAKRYVVLKAFTTKVEGRKAWVKGWIELLGEDGEGDGVKLVEAEGLFIEPKNAAMLAKFYADA